MSNSQLVYAGMVCLACMGVLGGMPVVLCAIILIASAIGFFVEQFRRNEK
jgi:hypothetical protein